MKRAHPSAQTAPASERDKDPCVHRRDPDDLRGTKSTFKIRRFGFYTLAQRLQYNASPQHPHFLGRPRPYGAVHTTPSELAAVPLSLPSGALTKTKVRTTLRLVLVPKTCSAYRDPSLSWTEVIRTPLGSQFTPR